MNTAATTLDALKRRRPEWVPWLAVIEDALDAAGGHEWDAAVPETVQSRTAVPLLAGAAIAAPSGAAHELLERLIGTAARTGTPQMATLSGVLDSDVDRLALLAASICQDRSRVEDFAAHAGIDREALDAVAGLLAVPFLQACHRRWGRSVPERWIEPYCPICGAWPAFAEVRGIERSRFFRCGRCGAGWHSQILKCPYCAMDDHEELVMLVPEQGGGTAVVEACRSCLGYVKSLTRLQGCPPWQVMIDDLATVDLDLAAVAEGYARPQGAGYALDVHVVAHAPDRRIV